MNLFPVLMTSCLLVAACASRNTKSESESAQRHNPIQHQWEELDSTLLAGYSISPEEVEQWKTLFTRMFEFDRRDTAEMKYFNGEDRYVTVRDLQNISLYSPGDSVPKRTCILWRLLQYAAKSDCRIPESEVDLAHLVHSQIDSVLRYEALSNADKGNKNGLEEYLNRWYYGFLSWRVQSKVSAALSEWLKREDEAWDTYHSLAMTAYYDISDSSGSGFHTWFFAFGGKDLALRRIGVEAWYSTVFPDAGFPRCSGSTVTEEQVSSAYGTVRFPHWPEELIEWGQSTESEMKASLNAEKESWKQWMAVRADVSGLLSGTEKKVWDNATNSIRREKIKLLCTAYNN